MIVLGASQRARIETIAERTYPEECCGLLIGVDTADGVVVTRIVESRNLRADRAQDRFEIDPQIRIDVERELRSQRERIVGHYHSHPDHPALWSSTDLAEAHWVGCSYVITSVDLGKAAVTNSFVLEGTGEDDKRFRAQPVEIAEAAVTIPAPTPVMGAERKS